MDEKADRKIDLDERYLRAMNRLTKWRSVFAGWQLGTRAAFGDGELQAVKDHRETSILERVEVDALVRVLEDKGALEPGEFVFIDAETSDAEISAVKEHRAQTMRLRAEINALTALLLEKGIFTVFEYNLQCIEEGEHLERAYEKTFPGARACDDGIRIEVAEFRETIARKHFPP